MSKQFWAAVERFFDLMNLAGDGELTPFEARATFGVACQAVMAAGSRRMSELDPSVVNPVANAQCTRIFGETDPTRRGYFTLEDFKVAYERLLSQHLEEEVIYIDIRRSNTALSEWHRARISDKQDVLHDLLELAYKRWVPKSTSLSSEAKTEAAKGSVSQETVDNIHYIVNGPHVPTRHRPRNIPDHASFALETINTWFQDQPSGVTAPGSEQALIQPHSPEHLASVAAKFADYSPLSVKTNARAFARLIQLLKNEQYCPKAKIYRSIVAKDILFPEPQETKASSDPESTSKPTSTVSSPLTTNKAASEAESNADSLLTIIHQIKNDSSISDRRVSSARLTHIFSRLLDLCIPPLAIAEAILGGNEVFDGEDELPDEQAEAATSDADADSDAALEELTHFAKSKFTLLPVGLVDHQFRAAASFQATLDAPASKRRVPAAPITPAAPVDDYSTPTVSVRPFISGGDGSGLPPRPQKVSLTSNDRPVYQSTTLSSMIAGARRMLSHLQTPDIEFREEDEEGLEEDE